MRKIAFASGKGGTGKTTVATNVAYAAARSGRSVAYVDCDVEEPNGHIFLKPQITASKPVGGPRPQVDKAKCTFCGKCGEICQYSAIVCLGREVVTFPELCHSCGGCSLVCPAVAISEVRREAGRLETGRAGDIQFVRGLLNVGQARASPVIKAVKASMPQADLVVIDAPPGASCSVVESVRGADLVVLVTEPTPFGLHDLKLAVEMVRELGLPLGAVLNRCDLGNGETRLYCRSNAVDIFSEIPDDRNIAEAYSRGEMVFDVLPGYRQLFESLVGEIGSRAH